MLLERGLGSLWLEGEISNLSRPSSGHWYFSLKDESAQVRCAMFRNRSMLVRFPVKDGARVLARGRVSLYEARGEFQVVIDHLEEAGEGALRRRFEELKRKLLAEGLFEAAQKKPLPTLPRRIGVITSPTGAALRDILHILQRRFPAVPVLVYPVAVQGEAASRLAPRVGHHEHRFDTGIQRPVHANHLKFIFEIRNRAQTTDDDRRTHVARAVDSAAIGQCPDRDGRGRRRRYADRQGLAHLIRQLEPRRHPIHTDRVFRQKRQQS